MRDFMTQVLFNLDENARARGRPDYHAQTIESCMAMYGLCMMIDVDFVMDIGTAAGASTVALAYALKQLGKDPETQMLTVCNHQGVWRDHGIPANEGLASHHGINLHTIPVVEDDFRTVYPLGQVKAGVTTLVFYDIHDHDDGTVPPSSHLLDAWVPHISRGIVAIHDVFSEKHAPRHAASADHFALGKMYGEPEIVPIVRFLNYSLGQMIEIPGAWIAFFSVEDGEIR